MPTSNNTDFRWMAIQEAQRRGLISSNSALYPGASDGRSLWQGPEMFGIGMGRGGTNTEMRPLQMSEPPAQFSSQEAYESAEPEDMPQQIGIDLSALKTPQQREMEAEARREGRQARNEYLKEYFTGARDDLAQQFYGNVARTASAAGDVVLSAVDKVTHRFPFGQDLYDAAGEKLDILRETGEDMVREARVSAYERGGASALLGQDGLAFAMEMVATAPLKAIKYIGAPFRFYSSTESLTSANARDAWDQVQYMQQKGMTPEEIIESRKNDFYLFRALARGHENYVEGFKGASLGYLGYVFGNEKWFNDGLNRFDAATERSQYSPEEIEKVQDALKDPLSFGIYVTENMATLFPQSAMFGLGGGTAQAAGSTGLRAIAAKAYQKKIDTTAKKLIARGVANKVAYDTARRAVGEQAVIRLGASLQAGYMYTGSSFASLAQERGIYDPIGAALVGVMAGSVTMLGGQTAFIERVLGRSAAQQFVNAVNTQNAGLVRTLLTEVVKKTGLSGIEEFIQESGATLHALYHDPAVKRTVPGMVKAYLENIDRPFQSAMRVMAGSGLKGGTMSALMQYSDAQAARQNFDVFRNRYADALAMNGGTEDQITQARAARNMTELFVAGEPTMRAAYETQGMSEQDIDAAMEAAKSGDLDQARFIEERHNVTVMMEQQGAPQEVIDAYRNQAEDAADVYVAWRKQDLEDGDIPADLVERMAEAEATKIIDRNIERGTREFQAAVQELNARFIRLRDYILQREEGNLPDGPAFDAAVEDIRQTLGEKQAERLRNTQPKGGEISRINRGDGTVDIVLRSTQQEEVQDESQQGVQEPGATGEVSGDGSEGADAAADLRQVGEGDAEVRDATGTDTPVEVGTEAALEQAAEQGLNDTTETEGQVSTDATRSNQNAVSRQGRGQQSEQDGQVEEQQRQADVSRSGQAEESRSTASVDSATDTPPATANITTESDTAEDGSRPEAAEAPARTGGATKEADARIRQDPPQVSRPTVLEPRVEVEVRPGVKKAGKGYAIPGAERLRVTVVPPYGNKRAGTASGWSVWVGDARVYANLPGGALDTAEQAISVATPKLLKVAKEIVREGDRYAFRGEAKKQPTTPELDTKQRMQIKKAGRDAVARARRARPNISNNEVAEIRKRAEADESRRLFQERVDDRIVSAKIKEAFDEEQKASKKEVAVSEYRQEMRKRNLAVQGLDVLGRDWEKALNDIERGRRTKESYTEAIDVAEEMGAILPREAQLLRDRLATAGEQAAEAPATPDIDTYLAREDLFESSRYAAEQAKLKAERTGVAQYLVMKVDGLHIEEDPGANQSKGEILAVANPPESKTPPDIKSLADYSVYPTSVRREDGVARMFAVKQPGSTGMGDPVFASEAQAEKEAAAMREQDENNAETRKKAEAGAKEKADAVAAQEKNLTGFLSQFEPMKAGKLRKTLEVSMTVRGQKPQARWKHIEELVAEGYRFDPAKKRLVHPDGRFFTVPDLTKTAMDYAAWLSQQQERTPWREAFDATDDASRKSDILRAIADGKSADKELSDVLDRMDLQTTPDYANIANAVAQNPAASKATKERALAMYEDFYNQPVTAPDLEAQPAAEAQTPEPVPAQELPLNIDPKAVEQQRKLNRRQATLMQRYAPEVVEDLYAATVKDLDNDDFIALTDIILAGEKFDGQVTFPMDLGITAMRDAVRIYNDRLAELEAEYEQRGGIAVFTADDSIDAENQTKEWIKESVPRVAKDYMDMAGIKAGDRVGSYESEDTGVVDVYLVETNYDKMLAVYIKTGDYKGGQVQAWVEELWQDSKITWDSEDAQDIYEGNFDAIETRHERQRIISVEDIDAAKGDRDKQYDLFMAKGAHHFPGLRLQDHEDAGRLAYVIEKGDATVDDWNNYVERVTRENRVSYPDKPIIAPKPVEKMKVAPPVEAPDESSIAQLERQIGELKAQYDEARNKHGEADQKAFEYENKHGLLKRVGYGYKKSAPKTKIAIYEDLKAEAGRLEKTARDIKNKAAPLAEELSKLRRQQSASDNSLPEITRLAAQYELLKAEGKSGEGVYNRLKEAAEALAREVFPDVTDQDLEAIVPEIIKETGFMAQQTSPSPMTADELRNAANRIAPIKPSFQRLRRIESALQEADLESNDYRFSRSSLGLEPYLSDSFKKARVDIFQANEITAQEYKDFLQLIEKEAAAAQKKLKNEEAKKKRKADKEAARQAEYDAKVMEIADRARDIEYNWTPPFRGAAHPVAALRAVINPKKTLLILQEVAIKDGVAMATDLDASVQVNIDLPDGTYKMLPKGNALVPSGDAEKLNDFPPVPAFTPVSSVKVSGRQLAVALKAALKAVSDDPSRPNMQFAWLSKENDGAIRITASNGYRAVSSLVDADAGGIPDDWSVSLSQSAMKAFVADPHAESVTITLGKPEYGETPIAAIENGNVRLVARAHQDKPGYLDGLFKSAPNESITVDRAAFKKALATVKKKMGKVKEPAVAITNKDGKLVISGEDKNGKQHSESIPSKVTPYIGSQPDSAVTLPRRDGTMNIQFLSETAAVGAGKTLSFGMAEVGEKGSSFTAMRFDAPREKLPEAPDTTPQKPKAWSADSVDGRPAKGEAVLRKNIRQNVTLDILKSMMVRKGRGITTDLEIEVEASVDLADGLYDDRGGIWVESGEDADGFPLRQKIQKPTGKVSIPSNSIKFFREALNHALTAASWDETRQILNGVYIESDGKKVFIVGTDGRRLHLIELKNAKAGELSVVLPRKTIELMLTSKGVGPVEITIGQYESEWKDDKGAIQKRMVDAVEIKDGNTVIRSRVIEGGFPRYRQVIPDTKAMPIEIPVSRQAVGQALAEIMPFIGAEQGSSLSVSVEITPNSIIIQNNPNEKQYQISRTIPVKGKIPKVGVIALNPEFFMDMVRSGAGDTITLRFEHPMSPAVIENGDGTQLGVLMPIRFDGTDSEGFRDVGTAPQMQMRDESYIPQTGETYAFRFTHNTEKSPNMGARFGQNIEPAGRYLNVASGETQAQNGIIVGSHQFNNPLVVPFGGGYMEPTNWKRVLSQKYNGKTGVELSQALREAGYDGIVTTDSTANGEQYVSEIVALEQVMVGQEPIDAPLVAIHNLSASNLLMTERLGGLAMPSLAVARADLGFNNFGEISLVGPPALIDPQTDKTMRVANADQYSPRYPSPSHTLSKDADKVLAPIEAWLAKTYGEVGSDTRKQEARTIKWKLDRRGLMSDFESPRDLIGHYGIMAYYAGTKLGKVFKGTESYDVQAELRNAVNEDREAFEAWVTETFDPIIEMRLFKGFTNMGNRRYGEWSLDEIMKQLKKDLKEGKGEGLFYGAGTIRGETAKRFRTLAEIQADRNKIVPSMEEAKEKANERLFEISDMGKAAYSYQPQFGFAETFWEAVLAANRSRTPRIELKEWGFDYDLMPMAEVSEFLKELRNMPTEYFEAKPRRVVTLDEFRGAIIPNTASQKVRDILKRHGLFLTEYKAGDNNDRTRAINSLSQGLGVQFQMQDTAPTDALGFYSAVERAVEGSKMNKAPAAQWRSWLKNQPGIKQEELDWLGIEGMEGTLTKDQVLDFVRANQVTLEETVLGQKSIAELSAEEFDRSFEGQSVEEIRESLIDNNVLDEDQIPENATYEDLRRLASEEVDPSDRVDEFKDAPKFDKPDLVTPGGENYREILIRMPKRQPKVIAEGGKPSGHKYGIFEATQLDDGRWAYVHPDGVQRLGGTKDTYEELTGQVFGFQRDVMERVNFESTHFDEPNILAHVRVNDRTDADGNRVLFVEEVQSDWHQQGREKGYEGKKAPLPIRPETYQDIVVGDEVQGWGTVRGVRDAEGVREFDVGGLWITQDRFGLDRVLSRDQRGTSGESLIHRGVPDAPFKKSWPMLAMKRLVRMAAEQGYDRIAWTTGEMQADRYDLSKHIDTLLYIEEKQTLRAYDGQRAVIDEVVQPEDLPNHIGKEMADRLLRAESYISGSNRKVRKLSGVELKIEHQGMKGFYDQILPAEVNKYVKKWGAKVGKTKIQGLLTNGETGEQTRMVLPDAVHSLDITDSMRESVMQQGQPMFQVRGNDPNQSLLPFARESDRQESTNEEAIRRAEVPETSSPDGRAERDSSLSGDGARWERRLASLKSAGSQRASRVSAAAVQGIEVDQELGQAPEFRRAAEKARTMGIELVPIKGGMSSGVAYNGAIYVGRDWTVTVEQTADHELFHMIRDTALAQQLMGAVNRQSPAFRQYKTRLIELHRNSLRRGGYDYMTANRIATEYVTDDRIAEEMAADRYAGIDQKYGAKVADAFQDGAESLVDGINRGVMASGQGDLDAFGDVQSERGPPSMMMAWHGTPHVFEAEPGFPHGRFRLDKIGTGEGAQAYGWGIYFAGARGVAEVYRRNTETRAKVQYQPVTTYQGKDVRALRLNQTTKRAINWIHDLGYDKALNEAIEAGQDSLAQAIKSIDPKDVGNEWREARGQNFQGNIYRLDIPDDVMPKLLDWDKPLSGEFARAINAQSKTEGKGALFTGNIDRGSDTGKDAYQMLSGLFGSDKDASEFLSRAGIPGLRYLDAGSRPSDIVSEKDQRILDKHGGDINKAIEELMRGYYGTDKQKQDRRNSLRKKFESITHNSVIWDQEVLDRIALLERNEQRLDEIMDQQDAAMQMRDTRGPSTVASSTSVAALRKHPDFKAAKYNANNESAVNLINKFYKPQVVAEALQGLDPDRPAVIVPIIAREGESYNSIPLALAAKVSMDHDIPVWSELVKISDRHNTDASAKDRARTVHNFAGSIPRKGTQIVLVDDTYTTGQTLAALAEVIGENPVAVITLSSGRYSKEFSMSPERKNKLLDKAGLTERDFERIYEELPEQRLTGAQAQQYILSGARGRNGLISLFPPRAGEERAGRVQQLAALPKLYTDFAGAGLLEAGLAGLVDPTSAVEYSPSIAQAYREAHGEHVRVADVNAVDYSTPIPGGVYHASPVCKSFSLLNTQGKKNVGLADMKAAKTVAKHIRQLQPKVVSIENVPAYQTTKEAQVIRDALSEQGYTFDEGVYDSAEYGAATKRRRYVLRAVKGNVELPAPKKGSPVGWYSTVSDIIDSLPESSIERANYITRSLAEQGVDLDNLEHPILVSGTTLFKKVAYANHDEPAFTFKATPATVDRIIMPDGKVKRVTARAKARMTGLPDSFPLPEDEKVAITIVGNGIPPPLVRNVIGPVVQQFAETDQDASFQMRDEDVSPEVAEIIQRVAEQQRLIDRAIGTTQAVEGDAARRQEKRKADKRAEKLKESAQNRVDKTRKAERERGKIKLEELREKVRQKQESVDALRKQYIEAVKQAAPSNIQKRFVGVASKIKTPKQLERAMNSLDNYIAKQEHSIAKRAFQRFVSRLNIDDGVRHEYRQAILNIIAGVDPKGMKPNHRLAIEKTVKHFQSVTNPDSPDYDASITIPESVMKDIERIGKTNINDLSADEIMGQLQALRMLVHQSRLKNKLLNKRWAKGIRETVGDIVVELEQNKGVLPPAVSMQGTLRQKFGMAPMGTDVTSPERGIIDRLVKEGLSRLENILDESSETLRELVWEGVGVQGYRKYLGLRHQAMDELAEAIERIAGVKLYTGSFVKWQNTMVEANGISMTRAEWIDLYGHLLDPSTRKEMLVKGAGITIERTDSPMSIGEREAAEIEASLPQEIKDMARLVHTFYNRSKYEDGRMGFKEMLNRTFNEVLGHGVAYNVDYYPRVRDMTYAYTGKAPQMQDLASPDYYVQSIENMGIFQKRVGSRAPIKVRNAFEVFAQQVDTLSRAIAYMPVVRDVKAVMGSPDVKLAIKSRYGQARIRTINKRVNEQVVGRFGGSDINNLGRRLMMPLGTSILSVRIITTPWLNPSGLFITAGSYEGGFIDLSVSLTKMNADPRLWLRHKQEMKQWSPFYRERYENNFIYHQFSGVGGEGHSPLKAKPLSQYGLAPIEATDWIGAMVRVQMAHEYVRRNMPQLQVGSDEYMQQVATQWERNMFRGENTAHPMEQSGAMAGAKENAWFGMYMMFQSSVTKIFSSGTRAAYLYGKSTREYKQGKKREARKTMSRANAALMGYLIATMWSAAVRTVGDDFRRKDEDEDRRWLERWLEKWKTELVSVVPLFGNILWGIATDFLATNKGDRAGVGKWRISRTGDTPVIDLVTSAFSVPYHIAQAVAQYNQNEQEASYDEMKSAFLSATRLLAMSRGLPYDSLKEWREIYEARINPTDERLRVRLIRDSISGLGEEPSVMATAGQMWTAFNQAKSDDILPLLNRSGDPFTENQMYAQFRRQYLQRVERKYGKEFAEQVDAYARNLNAPPRLNRNLTTNLMRSL